MRTPSNPPKETLEPQSYTKLTIPRLYFLKHRPGVKRHAQAVRFSVLIKPETNIRPFLFKT